MPGQCLGRFQLARKPWQTVLEVEIPVVFIEPRPKGRSQAPTEGYAVETSAGTVLNSFHSQQSAIDWAKDNGFTPLVALVRDPHKGNRDHWQRV